MKPCHENNGAAVYVGRAATVHNPLVCAGARPKRQTKTNNKEVCQVS